jgi:predicted dinucleotide-binding enzyme
VTRLYDQFGFDTVDNSPLSESWRSAPNTPMWRHIVHGQTREALARNLAAAMPVSASPSARRR